jgi:E3 ubiquitin-protein ligase MARCH6
MPPSVQARGFDNAIVGNGKGKAKAIDPDTSIYQGSASISAINNAASVLASLKQKRVAWGIPGAESWNLYDFERFEMTRFSIDLMFSPHGIVAEMDPWQLIVQAEVDRLAVQDGPMSVITAKLHADTMAVPDDWTEWLGHAMDDAWRWRARRRVLWERLQEEAERDGLGTLQLPRELSGMSIEELYMVQDASGIWTPPPAPRLISRLPALTALPPTPSYLGATDDGLSLLSAHKQLRAEGSRTGRSFTVSTASIASPDEDEGSSHHGRQRTQSQADTKPFSFPPAGGGGDGPLFPYALQRPLPFPITPTTPHLQVLPTQLAGSASSHRNVSPPSPPSSLTQLPFDPSLPPAAAIPIPRRPPMPNTTLPTPTSGPPTLLRSNGDSTPPASPSLATYQPPEEFQEGSARRGYFDGIEEGEGEVDNDKEKINTESFERDAPLFFKDDLIIVQHSGKESRLNAEEEEEEEDDEGDLPGLLADSDEDGEEDARELRGAARRGQRRAAWGPEWVDAGRADLADEDVLGEADDEGDDAEGDDVDDVALAAQLADEDMAVEDDMEGALEAIGMRGPLYVVAQNAALMIFVLDTAVGLGVWLPFTFGKSTALLSVSSHLTSQETRPKVSIARPKAGFAGAALANTSHTHCNGSSR